MFGGYATPPCCHRCWPDDDVDLHGLGLNCSGWVCSGANRIGKSSGYVSMVEADKVPGVSGAIVSQVAAALGTTTDYLLLLRDDPLPPASMPWDEVPEHIAQFSRMIEGMPAHQQQRAIEYLREQLKLFRDVVIGDEEPDSEATA